MKAILRCVSLVVAILVALSVPRAMATTVCFDLLSGRKCVDFSSPAPSSPKNSPGMSLALSTGRVVSGNSVSATGKRFKPGEYVRAFVFNVYGRASATELSGGAVASKKGVATVVYGTTSLPISVNETRTVCLRGEQSMLMACAEFSFEG